MLKNVKIEVTSRAKAGATTTTYLLEQFLLGLGLTVVRSEDTIVVSGELPPPEPQQAMAVNTCTPISILQEANQVIYGDREDTHGDPGKNLRTIAAYWNTHIKAAKSMEPGLTEIDVAGMMILLKQARLANKPTHRDSLVDIAGYAGLQDRIQNS